MVYEDGCLSLCSGGCENSDLDFGLALCEVFEELMLAAVKRGWGRWN
jgi:hypothetical protein